KAGADWIEILHKNNRYCLRLLHDCRSHGRRNDNDNVGLQCHKLFGKGLHCVDRTAGPPFFDPNFAAFCPSQCLQSLDERGTIPKPFGSTCSFRPQNGNQRQTCRLLRPRRERPRRRTAEQRDEVATLHSITSSAVICMIVGTVRPSALAVLRLITSSN